MKRWTKAETTELHRLLRERRLNYRQISEVMGKSKNAIAIRALRSGLGRRINKHKHRRLAAMEYFLTHSFEQTRKRFRLTASEFKSLQTVSYRDPALSHLRKDSRRHDVWSFDETMFLLRHAGLQERKWIASKLKRGTMHSVKEMTSRLGSNTRYINGLPRRLAEELVGHEVEGLKTKAGPTAPGVDCRPIIVPWVVLYSEARRSSTISAHFLDALRAMSRFQKRIHGTRGINDTVASIKRGIAKR